MKITFEAKVDETIARLNEKISWANSLPTYFNTVLYRTYQRAQIKRWETENLSETPGDYIGARQWKPLNRQYRDDKLKRFAGHPYAGKRMLIATGRLFKSVVGMGSGHRKIVDKQKITIGTAVPYAEGVAEIRPFMAFGNKTLNEMREGLKKYMTRGF